MLGAVAPVLSCATSPEDATAPVPAVAEALTADPRGAAEADPGPALLSSPIACNQTPPAGATLAPAPPPYSGGTCPMLVAGKNAIKSTGHARSFLLAVPKDLKPDEVLPVVFLWYWLGGSSDDFYNKGEVQAAVDTQRFLAVIPDAKSDEIFKWPFNVGDTPARQEEEYKFFDDMLSCVSAQFNVNRNCVSTAGVSAGALFTDQLASARSQYLASAISLSGGVGDGSSHQLVRPWGTPVHKVPMLILWGGPLDMCIVINFQTASHNLEAALQKDGHFFLECVHNCKHGEPPMEAPPGLSKYASLWRFIFDHPYWLAPGDSPYKTGGIPTDAGFPAWCGIGAHGAVPRTGSCPPPGC
jgi:predicted esterase